MQGQGKRNLYVEGNPKRGREGGRKGKPRGNRTKIHEGTVRRGEKPREEGMGDTRTEKRIHIVEGSTKKEREGGRKGKPGKGV